MRRNGVLNSNASKYASFVDYSYDTIKEEWCELILGKCNFQFEIPPLDGSQLIRFYLKRYLFKKYTYSRVMNKQNKVFTGC